MQDREHQDLSISLEERIKRDQTSLERYIRQLTLYRNGLVGVSLAAAIFHSVYWLLPGVALGVIAQLFISDAHEDAPITVYGATAIKILAERAIRFEVLAELIDNGRLHLVASDGGSATLPLDAAWGDFELRVSRKQREILSCTVREAHDMESRVERQAKILTEAVRSKATSQGLKYSETHYFFPK
jgi:hypothetical protein